METESYYVYFRFKPKIIIKIEERAGKLITVEF
jgi:hypothetical protein